MATNKKQPRKATAQKILSREEELQKELNIIKNKRYNNALDIALPGFKAYEGKFFKVRNGYNNKDRWWMYVKVISVTRNDLYISGTTNDPDRVLSQYTGIMFQTTTSNCFHVEMKRRDFIHSLEDRNTKEITEAEYNEAWNIAMDKLDEL